MMAAASFRLLLIFFCAVEVICMHFPTINIRLSPLGVTNDLEARRKDRKIWNDKNREKYKTQDVTVDIVAKNDMNSSTSSFSSVLELLATASSSTAGTVTDQLTYMQTMAAGALSRTMAQTLMHPANTYKTLLQLRGSEAKGGILTKLTPERLLRGVDAQFIMSIPHGACYFFVIDQVKTRLSVMLSSKYSFVQDFLASTISTVFCSVVSTPQMVLTDRLMAGVYPSFPVALKSIFSTEGLAGFYTGWWPSLAQKIPSYG